MANPKNRNSRTRRDMRRTNWKLEPVTLGSCPQCHEPVLQHHVCGKCGSYKGNTVIKKAE